MSSPVKYNNRMGFADRMIFYMSQVYASADTSSPPPTQESWDGLETVLAYYLLRGWRFT